MNNLDKQYIDLLKDILENGTQKTDRTGTGTISVFGRQIRHKMSNGFPLLTTKKMYFKGIVTELLWFLIGDTNIRYLVENDCNIWVGDALKKYHEHERVELDKFMKANPDVLVDFQYTKEKEFIEMIKTDSDFAAKWGELGPIYGKQWRRWKIDSINPVLKIRNADVLVGIQKALYGESSLYIDQIQNLIKDLKTNPDSRRLMVSAWNVAEIVQMVLPPCHYGFQVYTRELSLDERKSLVKPIPKLFTHEDCDTINLPKRSISLMWNQRSVDTPLGLPFNISSYGLLLEIIAKMVNMVPDELIGNLGDTHIYLNQIDGVKEQIARDSFDLPKLNHHKTSEFYQSLSKDLSLFTHLDNKDFSIENYQSHPKIDFPLSN